MSLFQSSTEITTVHDKILFWGPQHTGKTHTSLTWPGVALVDLETRGAHFADRFKFQHANVPDLKALASVIKELKKGTLPCETFVFDSYSAAYEKLVVEHTAGDKYVTDFVTVNKRIALLREFAFSVADRNIIFIAHATQKYAREGNNFTKRGVDFRGDEKFRFTFDYIFQLEPTGKDPRTSPVAFIVEKSASPNMKVGDKIVGLDYAKFYEITRGKPATIAPATAQQQHIPQATTDDAEPVGPDEVALITEAAGRHGVGMMQVADLAKQISDRTPSLEHLTKGEARRVYAAVTRPRAV